MFLPFRLCVFLASASSVCAVLQVFFFAFRVSGCLACALWIGLEVFEGAGGVEGAGEGGGGWRGGGGGVEGAGGGGQERGRVGVAIY